MPDAPIMIEDVERLDVRPGDTLVVKVPPMMSHAQADEIAEQFLSYFGDTIQVVVATGDVEVSVIRERSMLDEVADRVAEILDRRRTADA